MKLIYFDNSQQHKEFIGKTADLLITMCGENIDFCFETIGGVNDDFIYFANDGKIIYNDLNSLPCDYGIFPPMLLKKSDVDKYFGMPDSFFLLDINFAPEDNPSVTDLSEYGVFLAEYFVKNNISKDQILLFTSFPDIARKKKTTTSSSWYDLFDKQDFDLSNGATILADRIAQRIRRIAILSGIDKIDPDDDRLIIEASASGIDGKSSKLMKAFRVAKKAAPTEARIFIHGKNGTGKERFARYIHKNSLRKDNPLIEVNCAAIPKELIESELFGHEKGSFTSAISKKIGKFEDADQGTLFLDEIGDMSMEAQAKVLRALQEHTITRVGGETEIKINVRVISATNKDLLKEIEAGKFREDLYHRLTVIPINVPDLNDRKGDIPILIESIQTELFHAGKSAEKKTFSEDAVLELQKLNWTGNVRQLSNLIEGILILCDSPSISITDLEQNQMYQTIKFNPTVVSNAHEEEWDALKKAVFTLMPAKNFFPALRNLIITAKNIETNRTLVWNLIVKALHSAISNPKIDFNPTGPIKTHYRRVLLKFIQSLKIQENDEIILAFKNIHPPINISKINFEECTKQLGNTDPCKPSYDELRTILLNIIRKKLCLSSS